VRAFARRLRALFNGNLTMPSTSHSKCIAKWWTLEQDDMQGAPVALPTAPAVALVFHLLPNAFPTKALAATTAAACLLPCGKPVAAAPLTAACMHVQPRACGPTQAPPQA
jgi:hypothetical protein